MPPPPHRPAASLPLARVGDGRAEAVQARGSERADGVLGHLGTRAILQLLLRTAQLSHFVHRVDRGHGLGVGDRPVMYVYAVRRAPCAVRSS